MKLDIKDIERIVLLGGGKLIVALVRWCRSDGVPIFVVTSPRHSEELVEHNTSLKGFLINEKIPFLVTEDIASSEVEDFLGDLSDAFCLSLGAAWIFKKKVLSSLFKDRLFNSHPTRLPQNRGGGGHSWQILMGNRLGSCPIHLIDGGIDTGEIVRTEEFLIPPSCRKPIDYFNLHFEKNINFILDFIKEIRTSGISIETKKQSEYFSTYWPRLNTVENAWVNWSDSVEHIERFICAFDDPYEGAKTFLNDKKVFLKNVSVDYSDPQFHPYQAGIIYRKNDNWLSICANGGTLIAEDFFDEKGDSLLKNVSVGDRLYTPKEMLDERVRRVIYTPKGLKE